MYSSNCFLNSKFIFIFPEYSSLEGATGYTPSKDETIPKWDDPAQEEHEDEMHEVRRRRLERFNQENINNKDTKKLKHEALD